MRGRRATAERTGGVWLILPTNWAATRRTSLSGRGSCSRSRLTYSLPADRSAPTDLTAPLMVTGSAPVTLGSRVPPWPTSSTSSTPFIQAATWWLVGPAGLSSGTTPAAMTSSMVRSSGRLPYLSSVSAAIRTRRLRGRSAGSIPERTGPVDTAVMRQPPTKPRIPRRTRIGCVPCNPWNPWFGGRSRLGHLAGEGLPDLVRQLRGGGGGGVEGQIVPRQVVVGGAGVRGLGV